MKLVLYPEVVQTPCQPVAEGALDLNTVRAMQAFVQAKKGYGLAAPQIGDFRTYFVTADKVFVNPFLVTGGPKYKTLEACYSLPSEYYKVTRFRRVQLAWRDQWDKRHCCWFNGMMANIIQHEMDHLAGRCIIDVGVKRELKT